MKARRPSPPPRPLGAVPSFDELFARDYRRVVGLATALCGRTDVAEELAQDAFISAYRRWPQISTYDDPGAWVRRVTVNLATSTLRRRTREAKALARVALQRRSTTPMPDPDFWDAVRRLPRRQAQCVALRYLEDRSAASIAEILGIAEPTVRVHLHAARAALASMTELQGDDDADR